MNLLFSSVKSGLKRWCLVTGVQSQTPFPWFTENSAKRRWRGQTEQMLFHFLFLRRSALPGLTHLPRGREVQMLTEPLFWIHGIALSIRKDRACILIWPPFLRLILSLFTSAFERFTALLKHSLTGEAERMIEYAGKLDANPKHCRCMVCFPANSLAKQLRWALFGKKYLLSPTWQYTDFRMVDWSNAILHPPENCSHFHMSVVNRMSYGVFPTGPIAGRHTRQVYPPVRDAIIGAIYFDDPVFWGGQSSICRPDLLCSDAFDIERKGM